MKTLKRLFFFASLFLMASLVGCSKDNSGSYSDPSGGGSGGGGGNTRNIVTIGNDTYKIVSAGYALDSVDLYIQFETENPDVFLFFKGRNAIPVGDLDISYEAQSDNCMVTYYLESGSYVSINGALSIALTNGNYTIDAEGNMSSTNAGEKTFTIKYKGEIPLIQSGGSGGSGGGTQNNKFTVSPAFSYFHYWGGNGHINVHCNNANTEWTASSDSYWCELYSTGGTGDGRVNFYVYENYSTHNVDRTAKITFKSNDGKTAHAYVMQHPGVYDLEVSPGHLEFSAYGGERNVYVEVNNNYDPLHWTASCDASWVTLSQNSGDWSTDITVSVEQGSKQRSATIRFESENGTVRYITINQKAPEDVKIGITQAEYTYYVDNNMAFEVKYFIENKSKSYTLYYINFTVKHASGAVTTHSVGSASNPYG